MKKLLALCFGLVLVASTSFAEDKATTWSGEGKCAKCALKKTDSCQMALVVKEGDKEVTHLVAQNDVSKGFHKNICSATAKVKLTGTVKEVDGKKEIVASKIEKAG